MTRLRQAYGGQAKSEGMTKSESFREQVTEGPSSDRMDLGKKRKKEKRSNSRNLSKFIDAPETAGRREETRDA